ncbi:DNA-binding protein [Carnobacterium maltaromaticum]|uniref:DNA-binding protein n=1 Tax=Carnobacterium maltaromaticum TaxID=2751 RepID=UPI000C782F1E|nr:DNA-binding protein [Carnobacterium maltaromaticum]PLS32705.1 DNA-binding protein [Carnobacterium maltaromaticum]PLS33205.1 DNA-binding protein [Carnobacterium maltaromaticum]PLS33291.1 DNA-binding protein [Carnobacterium maltaromaticum]PLS41011.1 DNA-binding protein [Carnobacterium maltaromaticum]PLS41771.1 DNA-binding protein [Carnobacterium maltaromaticum]
MKDTIITQELPYLLTREQASKFLGIAPKSFDKFIRANDDLERFMIGKQERYTVSSLSTFVKTHSI